MSTKVFICYRFYEDSRFKDMLLSWSTRANVNFTFIDTSIGASINSTNAQDIKKSILDKIQRAPCFLCIVGKNTWKSHWVEWEIETAVRLSKKMIAVKTDSANRTPAGLDGIDVKWASSFTLDAVLKAILLSPSIPLPHQEREAP